MKHTITAVFVVLLIRDVQTLSVPALCAEDWVTYQHDHFHTGRSNVSFDPTELEFAWDAPAGFSTPAVVGETIYATRNGQGIGALDTLVRAFELRTGAEQWTFTRNLSFPSQAAYGAGLVVIAGDDRNSDFEGLYVLDATSGALKYRVDLPQASGGVPTIYEEPDGSVRAYYSQNGELYAVDLGENSGSVRWSGQGSFGDFSIPTIGGESVFVAGPGRSYAFNRDTGNRNFFFEGGIIGGGGSTAVFDETRNRVYVSQSTSSGDAVIAFQYADNETITEQWRYEGVAQRGDSSNVALMDDGNLVTTSSSTLAILDWQSGGEVDSRASLPLANGNTPSLSDGYIWTIGEDDVDIYDLNTLATVHALPGSRGNLNTELDSPGALFALADDSLAGFILDFGNIAGRPGFDVYLVPEPLIGWLVVPVIFWWAGRTETAPYRK